MNSITVNFDDEIMDGGGIKDKIKKLSGRAKSTPGALKNEMKRTNLKNNASGMLNIIKQGLSTIWTLIMVFIVVFVIYIIYNIRQRYPRFIWYNSYLDIAGKFDESTGLDLELADKLATALTNYITVPAEMVGKINQKSKSILQKRYKLVKNDTRRKALDDEIRDKICSAENVEDKGKDPISGDGSWEGRSVCDREDDKQEVNIAPEDDENLNIPCLSYIKKHLFERYEVDNQIYRDLRALVEFGPGIFASQTTKRPEKAEETAIRDSNTFLKEYYKIIINDTPYYEKMSAKFDKSENSVVYKFVDELRSLNDSNGLKWYQDLSVSRTEIHKFFMNILKTQSDNAKGKIQQMSDQIRNIFFRNVVYNVIYFNFEKKDGILASPVHTQLRLLESHNILSYIYPSIFKNSNDPGRAMWKEYGSNMYIELGDPKSSTSKVEHFKHLYKPEVELTPFIRNSIKNVETFNTPSELIDILTRRIQGHFSAETIEDMMSQMPALKYINKNDGYETVFKELKKYYHSKNGSSGRYQKEFNYQDDYIKYKRNLNDNKGKIYDSQNFLINDIYNFQETGQSQTDNTILKGDNQIPKHYNINKVGDNELRILEVYNHLIIFDNFYDFIQNNSQENKIFDYDEFVKYYYFFEKFTTLMIFDSDLEKLIDLVAKDEWKKDFIRYFYQGLKWVLYQRDYDIINVTSFATTALLNPFDLDSTQDDLLDLSKYYLSFMEIRLGQNFIRDTLKIKEHRTGYDIWGDFVGPLWEKYGWNIIVKEYIWKDLSVNGLQDKTDPYWKRLDKFLEDQCNFFPDPVIQDVLGIKGKCTQDKNEVRENLFGGIKSMLKGIKKIPKIASTLGKLFNTFIKTAKMLWKIFEFMIRAITNFHKLGPLRLMIFMISILFYALAQVIRVILAFPSIFPIPHTFGIPFGHALVLITMSLLIFIPLLVLKVSIILSLLLLMTVVAVIVWLLDMALGEINSDWKFKGKFTKFLYRTLMACENSPFSWYKNSRFDLENSNKKGMFCSLSCGTNYRLSENKAFCEKAPTNVPYYCPQPLLYKSYHNEKVSGAKNIQHFFINNYPHVLIAGPEKQADFVNNYRKNKREYYQTCQMNLEDNPEQQQIGKNVCAYGRDTDGKEISQEIKDLCRQTYCENGSYENFCIRYDSQIGVSIFSRVFQDEDKVIDVAKKSLSLAVILLILLYISENLNAIRDGNFRALQNPSFNNMRMQFNNMGNNFSRRAGGIGKTLLKGRFM